MNNFYSKLIEFNKLKIEKYFTHCVMKNKMLHWKCAEKTENYIYKISKSLNYIVKFIIILFTVLLVLKCY